MKAYVLLTALWFAFCAVKGSTTITSMNTASTPTIITSITTPSQNDPGSTTITSMNTASTPTIITSITTPSQNDPGSSTITSMNTASTPTIITSITTPSQNDPGSSTITNMNTASTPTIITSITTPSQNDLGSSTITNMNTASTPTIITSITTPSQNDPGSSTITNMNTASTPTIITSITTPSPNDSGSSTITNMNTASTPTIITSITTPSPNDSGSSTITNMNTASTPTIITSITTPSPNDSANSTIANTNTTSIPTIITSITTPSQNDSATTTTTTNTTTTTFSITTPSQTTSAPLPCEKNPCTYYGAECINLVDQEYVCKCPLGWYYANTSGCQQGQIFPGDLSLNNIPYTPSMEDVNSKEYKELYYVVTQICQTAFEDQATYKQTIILSVKSSSPTLKRRREAERMASPVVSLINMFDKSTTLNSSTVQSLVENVLNGSSFVPVSQCDTQKICDSQTTDCTEKADNSIATCECKPGLAKKNPQDNYCSLCADCSQENNKQCIVKEVPQCQCMTGYYDKDGRCQECNFGYSGEDCKDNYVAVIVGVAVACGIVIVVLVGVLIYKSLSAKKKLKPERRSLLSHDYSATETHSESKSAASVAPKEKIFPRVQTKNPDGQGGPAKNADERGLANTAYLPEQDYDDADPSSFEMSTRSKF